MKKLTVSEIKELVTCTAPFEKHLFGRVAGLAKASGCKAEFTSFDDEAADGYCRAVLRAQTDEDLNEAFYKLWETFEILEWNAAS
jgi:hypothetical protein